MAKPTPMLRQYRQLKARFPDAILLFRLGDFYEMFEEDAQLVSRQLSLVLTSRRFSKDVHLPMCGVPYRQLTTYLAKLLERGHKVAIAEQMEDARKVDRLVRRDVVRVITPGTVVEETLLEDKAQNYLVAVAPPPQSRSGAGSSGWGLAAVDLSTGEFVTTQFKGPEAQTRLLEELHALQPSEVVLPLDMAEDETWVARLQTAHSPRLSPLAPSAFDPKAACQRLLDHLGTASLEPYGCEHLPLATAAAGAVLRYLQESQVSELGHLRDLHAYAPDTYVGLDSVTRRNLELTCTLRDGKVQGSLLGVLDRTVTAMGGRLLRRWIQQPLQDIGRIQGRLAAVEELCPRPTSTGEGREAFLRVDLRRGLDGLYDVERLVGRVGFGTANARDLAALRQVLERIPHIKQILKDAHSGRLQALNDGLDELQDVATLIARTLVDTPPILIREGGLIRVGTHDELDRLRETAAEGRDWLTTYEAQERERTGISTLRVRYNQVFGFFVELPRSKVDQVPPEYQRRATITHAERFITPELKVRETEILAAEDRANDLEYDLFVDLRQQVAVHTGRLQRAARVLAELDVLAALAEVAARHGYIHPTVDESTGIEIKEGRHPVVERSMPDGVRFVPNDTNLDGESGEFLIITGPNMSGKSVYIRQVALVTLMAQIGSFVPATSARVGLVDRIFVRAGASDDIAQGRSTFLVEMSETAYILRHATDRSLVVLDEVGRGTSTYDGMGLAWAVGEDLHDRIGARTLFATHFYELTGLADGLSGARNCCMAAREQGDEVVFLYQLVDGGADRSYGVQVARLAGIPDHVVGRAREVMERLGQLAGSAKQEAREVREVGEDYTVGGYGEHLVLSSDDEVTWTALQEILGLDIANLTPVQALVVLNNLQQRLRGEEDLG